MLVKSKTKYGARGIGKRVITSSAFADHISWVHTCIEVTFSSNPLSQWMLFALDEREQDHTGPETTERSPKHVRISRINN
jgi:hypothetical protein